LVDWLSIHVDRVNVDRLTKLVSELPHKPVRAFWAGIAHWQRTDPRMKKLLKAHRGPRVDLIPDGGDFLIQRNGEDERFAGSPLRIAAKSLRQRDADILGPAELAKRHAAYRYRMMIGPTYRADMWAVIELGERNPAALARATYGSWPTAFYTLRDWTALHGTK
ncbi:MAG: hypothetical protein ACXVBL_18995, partial [Bdellovibrionota bacterium]